jgi:hypothetical protein
MRADAPWGVEKDRADDPRSKMAKMAKMAKLANLANFSGTGRSAKFAGVLSTGDEQPEPIPLSPVTPRGAKIAIDILMGHTRRERCRDAV